MTQLFYSAIERTQVIKIAKRQNGCEHEKQFFFLFLLRIVNKEISKEIRKVDNHVR